MRPARRFAALFACSCAAVFASCGTSDDQGLGETSTNPPGGGSAGMATSIVDAGADSSSGASGASGSGGLTGASGSGGVSGAAGASDLDASTDGDAATIVDGSSDAATHGSCGPATTGFVIATGEVEPAALASGDFDGDGKLDVVISGSLGDGHGNGGLALALGHGDGTFANASFFPVAPGGMFYPMTANALATGDFDGDGKLDVVAANVGLQNVSVLLGTAGGGFASYVTYDVGDSPDRVVTADFDGDGRLDLATANDEGTLSLLRGNGDGTFGAPVKQGIGGGTCVWLGAVDVDGDHDLDLVIAQNDMGLLHVETNDGHGTFTVAANIEADGLMGAAEGDFDGDAFVDLAYLDQTASSVVPMHGNGDGTFTALSAISVPTMSFGLSAGDVDGDGHLDLVTSSAAESLTVLFGNGSSFAKAVTVPQPVDSETALGDWNGDGQADVVFGIGGSAAEALLATSTGFPASKAAHFAAGKDPASIVSADVDGDGNLDLVVGDAMEVGLRAYLGKSDGTFSMAVVSKGGVAATVLAAADVDGDGKSEIVAANDQSGVTWEYVPSANGALTAATMLDPGGTPSALALGDVDGDGHVDLAAANVFAGSDIDGNVSVLLGLPGGGFAPAMSAKSGDQPTAIAFGPATPGQPAKLYVAGLSQVASVSVSNGALSISVIDAKVGGYGFGPHSLVARDFDGDGALDLVTSLAAQTLHYFHGRPDGSFDPSIAYPANVDVFHLVPASFGGSPLVVGSGGSSAVFLWSPVAPTTFEQVVTGPEASAVAVGPAFVATTDVSDVAVVPVVCSP